MTDEKRESTYHSYEIPPCSNIKLTSLFPSFVPHPLPKRPFLIVLAIIIPIPVAALSLVEFNVHDEAVLICRALNSTGLFPLWLIGESAL